MYYDDKKKMPPEQSRRKARGADNFYLCQAHGHSCEVAFRLGWQAACAELLSGFPAREEHVPVLAVAFGPSTYAVPGAALRVVFVTVHHCPLCQPDELLVHRAVDPALAQ